MSSENFRLPLANGGLAVAKLWPKDSSGAFPTLASSSSGMRKYA